MISSLNEQPQQSTIDLVNRVLSPATPAPAKQSRRSKSPYKEEGDEKLTTAEARRQYQRRYYETNKARYKEYHRTYSSKFKKKSKGGRGQPPFEAPREVIRFTFNTHDIMHSPTEKSVRMLEKIIRGERLLTM